MRMARQRGPAGISQARKSEKIFSLNGKYFFFRAQHFFQLCPPPARAFF
jgi:hypothetical protein